MQHYTNIDLIVDDYIRIIIRNDGILQYVKNILVSNFKFKYSEIKNNNETILLISEEDVPYEVFKRHFEIITDEILEQYKT